MKVLSIGNSFSVDAHQWLHKLAEINGIDMQLYNLYIGGCSLERHWQEYENDTKEYELLVNGEKQYNISLRDGLNLDEFDVVTFQQASHFSGVPQTYFPFLANLLELVKAAQPKAKLYFHETWAYEVDSDHGGFAAYNNDQKEMFRRIGGAARLATDFIGGEIIPSGTVIQKLRETVPEFDYKNGGMSLNRDGFHLSLDYGRFAAAATWLYTLTGIKPQVDRFEDFDTELLNKIIDTVVSI